MKAPLRVPATGSVYTVRQDTVRSPDARRRIRGARIRGWTRRRDRATVAGASHSARERRRAMEVLLGATLIDGTGASPVPDAAVVIDGERIVAAGSRGSTAWPNAARVVDLNGLTLLPGLIDTHDHLASHGYALATR